MGRDPADWAERVRELRRAGACADRDAERIIRAVVARHAAGESVAGIEAALAGAGSPLDPAAIVAILEADAESGGRFDDIILPGPDAAGSGPPAADG